MSDHTSLLGVMLCIAHHQYRYIGINITTDNTIQYNTIQYNTIQYNTIQYNAIQYNTTQYLNEDYVIDTPHTDGQNRMQAIPREEKRKNRERSNEKMEKKIPLESKLVNTKRNILNKGIVTTTQNSSKTSL